MFFIKKKKKEKRIYRCVVWKVCVLVIDEEILIVFNW